MGALENFGFVVVGVGLALYHWQQMLLVTLEQIVKENHRVIRAAAFVEVVHVDLPNERVHVAVPEVRAKDFVSELRLVPNFEAIAFFGPANDVRVFWVTYDRKQFFKEDWYKSLPSASPGCGSSFDLRVLFYGDFVVA